MSFKEEREAIVGVLEFTGRFLELLISRLRPEDRTLFEDTWKSETKPQLEQAINALRGQPGEEDIRRRAYEIFETRGRGEGKDTEDWMRAESELREGIESEGGFLHLILRRVGLAGRSLRLKLEYLAQSATGGWRTKLLKLLNKFLGSLAAGLPGVESVKEFKEWLEDFLDGGAELDPTVGSVYHQMGNDPFRLNSLKLV